MKRSEIIRKVAETVKPILNNDLTSDIGLTSHGAEQLVNIVLAALEEAGMIPPKNGMDYSSHFDSNDEYVCTATPSYGWDPE